MAATVTPRATADVAASCSCGRPPGGDCTSAELLRGPAPAAAENLPELALGRCYNHRLDPDRRPAASALTSSKPSLRIRKKSPRGPWNPGHRPASRATVIARP